MCYNPFFCFSNAPRFVDQEFSTPLLDTPPFVVIPSCTPMRQLVTFELCHQYGGLCSERSEERHIRKSSRVSPRPKSARKSEYQSTAEETLLLGSCFSENSMLAEGIPFPCGFLVSTCCTLCLFLHGGRDVAVGAPIVFMVVRTGTLKYDR